MPGREFFAERAERDQAKVLALFMRVEDVWEMPSREKFRKLEDGVFELKPKTPRKEIDRAQRIMRECTEGGEPNE